MIKMVKCEKCEENFNFQGFDEDIPRKLLCDKCKEELKDQTETDEVQEG